MKILRHLHCSFCKTNPIFSSDIKRDRAFDVFLTLGPCIAQESYEVGPEFVAAFAAADASSQRFFAPGARDGRAMFDLSGYIAERARRAGIGRFESLGLDTYADAERFYSYRRATHRAEPDYGRLVAAVALA